MVFWIAVGVIVLVLAALAWWSSGRARPRSGTDDGAFDYLATKRQGYGPGPG
jgi:hypothetical protein